MATPVWFLAAARTMVGPPMSMFSMISSSVAPRRSATSSNGYRFTTTRSMGSMPSSWMAFRCSWLCRSARMPPWIAGCSVFTRPSMISGNPVTSDTGVTGIPTSLRNLNVPPVEMSSMPRSARPRANDSRFPLSDTDTSARRTFTAPPPSPGDLRRPIVVDPDPARSGFGRTDLPQREQLYDSREHPVLQRVETRTQAGGGVVAMNRERFLRYQRTGVHAGVDEMHRDPSDLGPVTEGVLDTVGSRKGRQKGWVQVDDLTGEALEELRSQHVHVAVSYTHLRAHE